MPRARREDNPVFVQFKKDSDELKTVVDRARADAEASIRMAKESVKGKRAALIKEALDAGLSVNSICLVWGITSGKAQVAFIEEALGSNYVPAEKPDSALPTIKVGDFEARVTKHWVNAWSRVESDWVFSHPDFEDEALWFEGVDDMRWPADSAMRGLWVDGDDWGDPRYADLNELVRQVQRWQP